MDDSIFDCIFANLDAIRASLDSCSSLYTDLVIAGVVCEILFIWIDHHDDFKAWKSSMTYFKIPFPERPGRSKLLLELASVGLVVWGLWGELHTANRIQNLDMLIRAVNEYRASLLEREAGDAKQSAIDAAGAAGKAQGSANKAGVDARLANDSAKHLAVLQVHFAGEAQHRQLVPVVFDSLSNENERVKAHITCIGTIACEFSNSLVDALKGFGWDVSFTRAGDLGVPAGILIENKWVDTGDRPVAGVSLHDPGNADLGPPDLSWQRQYPEIPEAQRRLLLKLGAGLHARLIKNPKLDDNEFKITVGVGP